jgi:threonine dehydrogenase-like Zn-dependent dehydrogenase
MKALVIRRPGEAAIENIPEPPQQPGQVLLRVRMIGLCGSDLNSYRGKNPLVRFPRIPGHEIAATILEPQPSHPELKTGTNVTLSPYTNCGKCASCLRGRRNACQFNETLGVQRDGALLEQMWVPPEKLYPANLSIKELCIVEPLTV